MANLTLSPKDTTIVLAGRQQIINENRPDYVALEAQITAVYNGNDIVFGSVPAPIGDDVDHPRIPPTT